MRAERSEPTDDLLETPASPGTPVGPAADPLTGAIAQAASLAARGRAPEAYARIEKALANEGGQAPLGVRASLLTEAAVVLWLLGRYEESEARARRGLALAELDGDAALAADALLRLGLALQRRGELEAAREAYEEARARFRRLGDAAKAGAASNNLGLVCKDRGQWELARAHLAAAVASARRHGDPRALATRLQNLGVLELKSGLWARAAESLEEARTLFAQVDDARGTLTNRLAFGTLARLERRLDEAAALGKGALELALAQRMQREEAIACELLGDVALDRGDLHAARTHYGRAQRIAQRVAPAADLASETLRRLAGLALAENDATAAARAIEKARVVAARLGDPYESAAIDRLEADRLLALDQADAGRALLADVAAAFGEMGERFERGKAFARLAALESDADGAMRLGIRASACFAEVGAEAERREVEALVAGRLVAGHAEDAAGGARTAPAAPRVSLIGASRATRRLRVRLSRAARHEFPVLIRGERGTGKDLVARLVHERSRRAAGPFVVLRCDELAPERMTARLFGDVRAALPARERVLAGALERADGGTLYVDAIEALSRPAQAGLVRFLVRGLFYRVGELEPRKANVRLVASTRLAPAAEPLHGELLARFARGTLDVPPLRLRREDIAPLARAFLAETGVKTPPRLSAEAVNLLLGHSWPGNVRELRECMEQLIVEVGPETALVEPGPVARLLDELTPQPEGAERQPGEETTLLEARLRELERQRILRSLSRAHGNKTRAAQELGIARKTLYERLRRLGIREA